MNQKFIRIIVFTLIGIIFFGTTGYFYFKKPSLSYGKIENYFTGADSITYPLIFDDIRLFDDTFDGEKYRAIHFGPTELLGFDASMIVNRMSSAKYKRVIADLSETGDFRESNIQTRNGGIGEIWVSDEKAHPTDSETCSFRYYYFIPLNDGSDYLLLDISFGQREWGISTSSCLIFEERNYQYLKAIIDYVIENN